MPPESKPTDFEVQRDLQFSSGLAGDLYLPKKSGKHPGLVAVHGGGWQIGDKDFYQHWGPYLAQRGIAVFSVNYRLAQAGKKTYPEAVQDVRAGVQFLRERQEVDGEKIGLIGDSAGAHLAALVALSGDTRVKALVGIYGVYDMAAQWEMDLVRRPLDNVTQKFLGASPLENRRVFFEASPLSYATIDRNKLAVLLVTGNEDDVVDRRTQTDTFLRALKQAGFFARTVIVPGSGHFWMSDPHDEPGSFPAALAPKLVRFLQQRL
jgi:acetyl esterase/lipase